MKSAHFQFVASILGFIGVACGAFGAHALKQRVSADDLEIWKTAVSYLLVHALVTLFAAERGAFKSCYAFLIGCFIFSGSLFALVLTNERWLGAVTPLGGLSFLAGWLFLAFHKKSSR